MLYLGSSDYRLIPINQLFADLILNLILSLTKHTALCMVWFACEEKGPFPKIINQNRLKQPQAMKGVMEPVYWKYYEAEKQSSKEFADIWNAFGGVRIYPAQSQDDVQKIVYNHYFDRRDERKLGMDYGGEDPPKIYENEDILSAVSKLMKPSFDFAGKLGNKTFREQLFNPFCYENNTSLVKEIGVYAYKSGHDEVVTLELMTKMSNLENIAGKIFKKFGLNCEIVTEEKTSWGGLI